MQPKVWVVILSWNGREDTLRCLRSIQQQTLQPQRIVAIDNGSQDGLEEPLAREFPQVQYRHLPENLGFGGGMNAGLRLALEAGADFILALNNDAWLQPDCLEKLLAALQAEPAAAAVSPKIYLQAPAGHIYFNGGRFTRLSLKPVHAGENRPDAAPADAQTRATEFLNACCPLFRSAALKQTGLFDASFFAYYEDADLSVRLRRAGWTLLVAPGAKAVHGSGRSFQRNAGSRPQGTTTPWKWFLDTRNRLWFLRRYGSWWQKAAGRLVVACARLGLCLALLLRARPAKAAAVARGLWQGLTARPSEPPAGPGK